MADKLLIEGGHRLFGEVPISGAKNSALKLMAASLLASGRTTIERVPRILDCLTMGEVLQHLGADVRWHEDTVEIDTTHVDSVDTPYELVSRMRASIIVLGPLLARHGRARVAMPGGCNIGARSIDLHLRGLERLGATFDYEHGYIEARAQRLHGLQRNPDGHRHRPVQHHRHRHGLGAGHPGRPLLLERELQRQLQPV